MLIRCFSLDLPATGAAVLCGLSRSTAQRVYILLRIRIVEMACEENCPFTGEIEVDESYFGARRVRGKRGRGAAGKSPVIGLLKRGQSVFVKVVKDCSRKELEPVIRGQVLSGATVYTD